MPQLDRNLTKIVTKKTDATISVGGFALWFSAIITGGLLERYGGWTGFAIALIAGAVYAAGIVIMERRVRYWVGVSCHAGMIASTAVTYRHSPETLRDLADLIEKENQ